MDTYCPGNTVVETFVCPDRRRHQRSPDESRGWLNFGMTGTEKETMSMQL
jgi:hypothetical protein